MLLVYVLNLLVATDPEFCCGSEMDHSYNEEEHLYDFPFSSI
jgi:hypothetical protein